MTNNILGNMEHYMFTQKTLNGLNNNKLISHPISDPPKKKDTLLKVEPELNKSAFFSIKDNDQLFWCYYIMKYGIIKYQSLLNNTFTEEQREKIQLVEMLRNNKELLKKNKWKKNIIEGELVAKGAISIKTFLCICTMNNLNICIIKERYMFSKMVDNDSENNIIIKNDDAYKLSILDRVEKDKLLEEYTKKYWVIDNIDKPLLTLGAYKLLALQNIASKLKIPIYDTNKKRYRKIELYNMIKSKI